MAFSCLCIDCICQTALEKGPPPWRTSINHEARMKKYILILSFCFVVMIYLSGCSAAGGHSVAGSGVRVVVLKRDLYINTPEGGSGNLQGVTWKWFDASRQQRVAVIHVGERIVLESVKIEGGGLFSGYTTFKCRSMRHPDLRFDFSAGVDGKITESCLPW